MDVQGDVRVTVDFRISNAATATAIYTLSLHDALPICTARATLLHLEADDRVAGALDDADHRVRVRVEQVVVRWGRHGSRDRTHGLLPNVTSISCRTPPRRIASFSVSPGRSFSARRRLSGPLTALPATSTITSPTRMPAVAAGPPSSTFATIAPLLTGYVPTPR